MGVGDVLDHAMSWFTARGGGARSTDAVLSRVSPRAAGRTRGAPAPAPWIHPRGEERSSAADMGHRARERLAMALRRPSIDAYA
ncbi:hypothetical protein GCM10010270_11440 [Streptomyces violaceus]|nr:hypothetical protein GCM10010270_11440 [Streptomyces janthinus]